MHWYQENLKENMVSRPEMGYMSNDFLDNTIQIHETRSIVLTSHATQRLSLNPMGEAPLETIAAQKTLTQFKGRIMVHLMRFVTKRALRNLNTLNFIVPQS